MALTPRPGIMEITPYTPGKSSVQSKQSKIIKLSSNESALGASPKAIEAYANHASILRRYPDGTATPLRQAIGKTYGLDENRIVCGAGSDELIALLIQAFAGPGDEVLYSQYGFLMYPISTLKVGAKPVTAPEKDLRTDITAIANAITDKTKIVFIANPNNPTGSYLTNEEMRTLRKSLPDDVLLVIDSAYAEFVTQDDYTDGSDIVDLPGENTVILHTFSKIYGLASLRLGWAYCPPSITDILHRVRGPFNVPGSAIAAGEAAIYDTDFLEKSRDHNTKWLNWLEAEVTKLGLTAHPSQGNFILVEFPQTPEHNAKTADTFLRENGIIVRDMNAYQLPQCLRITIGLEEENKAVITALATFLESAPASSVASL